MYINEMKIDKIIRRVINEHLENVDSFEEYCNDYPNDDFDASWMSPSDLAEWCDKVGDFLYVYNGLNGTSIKVANTDNIVSSIVDDLYNCRSIEPSHDVDNLFFGREEEFVNDYVCIFKVNGVSDGDYYIVYQEEK